MTSEGVKQPGISGELQLPKAKVMVSSDQKIRLESEAMGQIIRHFLRYRKELEFNSVGNIFQTGVVQTLALKLT